MPSTFSKRSCLVQPGPSELRLHLRVPWTSLDAARALLQRKGISIPEGGGQALEVLCFTFLQVIPRYRQGCKSLYLTWISHQVCENASEKAGDLFQVTQEIHSKSGSEKSPTPFQNNRAHLSVLQQTVMGTVVMARWARVKEQSFHGILGPPKSSVWVLVTDLASPPTGRWPVAGPGSTRGHPLPQGSLACEKSLAGNQSQLVADTATRKTQPWGWCF